MGKLTLVDQPKHHYKQTFCFSVEKEARDICSIGSSVGAFL